MPNNCSGNTPWIPLPTSGQPSCEIKNNWTLMIEGLSVDYSTFLFFISLYKIEFYFLNKNVLLMGNDFTANSIPGYEFRPPLGTEYTCRTKGIKSSYCVSPSDYYSGCLQQTKNSTKDQCEGQESHILLWENITHNSTRNCQSCSLGDCDNIVKCNSIITGYCIKPDFQGTCSILSVNGNVASPGNTSVPWYEGDDDYYCRYQKAGQWMSRANSTDANQQRVDILCHYVFDILPKGFTFGFDSKVRQWETDMFNNTNPDSGVSLQSDLQFRQMVQFYMYIYYWVDLYYSILFELVNQQIFPYTQNDLYINNIIYYIPFNFEKTQDPKDLRDFLNYLLVQPIPKYDSSSKSYRLRIRMGYRIFEKTVLNQKKSDIDIQITKYLNHYLQEDSVYIYKKGRVQSQIFSSYTIVPDTINCLQMVPEARLYKINSIQNLQNPLPYPFDGFNNWYKIAKADDVYNPSITGIRFEQNNYNIPFVICIQFEVTIEKWSAPLVAIMKPVIYSSIDFCNYLFEYTGVYPQSCSQHPTDITSYKQFVDNACNTQIITDSVAIQSIISENLSYQDSLSTTCSCYYSGLMPPNLLTYANPTAMCFDRNCTDSDRKLVNATKDYCKNNCKTVYNWMYSKNQTISKNPGALDKARFQQLCGSRNIPINWNVFGNGIGIVILITIILIVWKRYWACLYISCPLLAIMLFLAFDLKLQSFCDANNIGNDKPFLCNTAYTKIPMPKNYCDYMSCECIFDEQCSYTCTCASGKCVPQIQGFTKITTTQKSTVQWNVMGTLFILVLLIFCVMMSRKIESKAWYRVWLISSVLILIISMYFLTICTYNYSVYDGSCIVPAQLYVGTQSSSDRTILLDAPIDVPRYNVLFASIVSDITEPQFVTGNVLLPTHSDVSFQISNIIEGEKQKDNIIYYAIPSLGNTISLGRYGSQGSNKVQWDPSSTSLHIDFKDPFKSVPVVIGTPYFMKDQDQQIIFVSFQLLNVTNEFFECCLVDDKGQPQTHTVNFSWVAIGETSSSQGQFFEIHQTNRLTSKFTTTALTNPPAIGCIANSYTSSFVAIPLIYNITNTGIEFSCAFKDEMAPIPNWSFDLNNEMFSQNISFNYFIC